MAATTQTVPAPRSRSTTLTLPPRIPLSRSPLSSPRHSAANIVHRLSPRADTEAQTAPEDFEPAVTEFAQGSVVLGAANDLGV
ncbi:hypothetical protein GCM10009556_089450 [Acrocarpospora pleiomorpha]